MNKWLLATILITLILSGCTNLKPMTFEEIYEHDLSDVSKIEIRHGNGELKSITDKSIIDPWLEEIKDIIFEPSADQERQVGYLYDVTLFEGNDKTLSFSTTRIKDFYYVENQYLLEKMHTLFNEN